jgi:hypothetical protein
MRFHEIVLSAHTGSDNRDASLADGGIDLSNTGSSAARRYLTSRFERARRNGAAGRWQRIARAIRAHQ